MKIDNFKAETWMTLHENNCLYNLADACAQSLTLDELLNFSQDKETKIQDILNMKLDYGPIEGSHQLKQGILKLYQTGDDDQIAITHGGINANELGLISLLEPQDHIITITPTYQQIYSFPQSLGVSVDFVNLKEENDWLPSIYEFEKLITPKTKMICLTTPNNPTGTTFDKSFLEKLVVLARKHDLYIFCDEAYRGLGENEVSISDIYEKGISAAGISKILSAAGLRIGWIKTPDKNLIKMINERRDYHIISSGSLSDYLACVVFQHYDQIIERNKSIIQENKKYFKSWLKDNPLVSCVIPDHGTVCFLKYHLDIPSAVLAEKLQQDTGVFFVPGACFDLEYHLRFGLANNPQTVKKGLTLFGNWLKTI